MYITTFYSFKGGVGRTLALVNVGAELVRRGKRVLLVDFDLEAPGVTTFPRLQPLAKVQGVVDFVGNFIATRVVPRITDFVYEATEIRSGDGRMWVMPAGLPDQSYARKLASINWTHLYEKQDGYHLFEDMKEQWRREYQPDYVLIDSRTGHTEVSGICTRQLPDAVCVLFFPNEQNLTGLRKVITEIREEESGPRHKHIDLHFVMSNVPDLDDEDQILARRMDEFAAALGYKSLSGVIHRYDSLALLNQSIFVLDRPASRLTKEYKAITETVTNLNLEDSTVAAERLVSIGRKLYGRGTRKGNRLPEEVDTIAKLHPGEPRILYLLSRLQRDSGNLDAGLKFVNQSIALGHQRPEVLLHRAELLQLSGDARAAARDLLETMNCGAMHGYLVQKLIRMLRRLSPESITNVPKSRAVQSLTPRDRIGLCDELLWTPTGAVAAVKILNEITEQLPSESSEFPGARAMLALAMMSARDYASARNVLSDLRSNTTSVASIELVFNSACASWAITKVSSTEEFLKVVQMDASAPTSRSDQSNYEQCLALSLLVAERMEEGLERLKRARGYLRSSGTSSFSCWRYLMVTAEEFLADCADMEQSARTGKLLPRFVREAAESDAELPFKKY